MNHPFTSMLQHVGCGSHRAPGVSRAGFTLVEVALALAVVAVGMLGVMALLPVGVKANRDIVLETHYSNVQKLATSVVQFDRTSPYRDQWRGLLVPIGRPPLSPESWMLEGGLDWDNDGFPDFHIQYRMDREDEAERITNPFLTRVFIRIGFPVQGELNPDFDYNKVYYTVVELANDSLEEM